MVNRLNPAQSIPSTTAIEPTILITFSNLLLHRLFTLNPTFDTSIIDIVGCGSTLTHLLSFALNEKRSFSFKVEKIGNAIFLIRQEDIIKPFPVPSYKRTMASAFTTWAPDVADSESHQRIVSYTFGGLNMVVRYESDACMPSIDRKSKFEDTMETYTRKRKLGDLEDNDEHQRDSRIMRQKPAVWDSADLLPEHLKGKLVIDSAGLEISRQKSSRSKAAPERNSPLH